MHFAALNYILMRLRCYIDSWVYCTNSPSLTYLWPHLQQGKLQEDVETVGPSSTLCPTVDPLSCLLSGINAYSHQSGRWHNVACLLSTFCKKQTLPWNPNPLFWLSSENSKLHVLHFGELMHKLWNAVLLEWCVHRLPLLPNPLSFCPNTQGDRYQQLSV